MLTIDLDEDHKKMIESKSILYIPIENNAETLIN